MTTLTPVRAGVSLEALLAAKDSRAARQADWLTHYQQPVISLTLVTPGAVKDQYSLSQYYGRGAASLRPVAVATSLERAGQAGTLVANRRGSLVVC